MKVLLIVHDLYQEDVFFPLGAGYIAAVLQELGVDITICSSDIYHYTHADMIEKFLCYEYDYIMLGFLSARFTETILGLCKIINKHKRNAKLVLGGHGASALPEYTLRETNADIIVIGEAEKTIRNLIKGVHLNNLKGIAYRINNKVHINDRRKPADLNTVSMPAWDLFPMHEYVDRTKVTGQRRDEKGMQLISSRGCINRCTFCHRLEVGERFRDMKDVVFEMRYLYDKFQVTYFTFFDELLITSISRLEKFVEALKIYELYGKIRYNSGGVRANCITYEIARMFKDSGCCYLNIGFESMSPSVLKSMKKNVTPKENVRCLHILRDVGIHVGLNFIWGMPGDTEQSLRLNAETLKKYNDYNELRTIRPVTPYPGSELYNYAIEKRLLDGPEDFYKRFKNSDLITVNFTKLSVSKMYDLLFEINRDLITDHCKNVGEDPAAMISQFHDLYFETDYTFRGSRKYNA